MKFGVCTSPDNAELIKECGFDYIELNLSRLAGLSEQDFLSYREKLDSADIKADAYNGFFPGDQVIVGDSVDMDKLRKYTRPVLERAASLGGKIAVFGSGKVRRIPGGLDKQKFIEQLVDVLKMMGDEAKRVGMTIAIEPLNTAETNVIITVAEGMEMVRRVNHPNVKCLADFYHIYKSGETLDAVKNGGKDLVHVHIARANGDRCAPCSEDISFLKEWAQALKECGYDARISLECSYKDFKNDVKIARELLRVFEGE